MDPECDVGRPPVFAEYPDRLYTRAGALGSAASTFAAMGSLPWERRGGRLAISESVRACMAVHARATDFHFTNLNRLLGSFFFFDLTEGPQGTIEAGWRH